MSDPFLTDILPQLASGAAHTHSLGFRYEGVEGDRVRLRTPWRADLVGDPETEVFAGGLVTAMLDHVGGLAVWVALGKYAPIATLDLRIDYMRAARPRVDLLSEARCYKLTRTIGFVRAWAFEDDPADPVAAAQATYVINARDAGATGSGQKAEGDAA
ncbi:PaaI family thioesterase [Brevundimonas sp. AJA228-03]|uniref:PaaI family thioesterase n=1 Tax=Brevundimonas sp. AJA228-03 TaxID=2752515 RepID=UPI001AE01D7E|nr:PaaI family thioesterase [Brevundimonas sp. AJA228-03]QTN18805.1 PaaI family thioesterase [Brevundimonas sp. AJA228-03]